MGRTVGIWVEEEREGGKEDGILSRYGVRILRCYKGLVVVCFWILGGF